MASHGSGPGMIRRVLTVTFVLIIIALVIFWIVTGGIGRAMRTGEFFTDPIAVIFGTGTTTGTLITLPWQQAAPRGPDISGYATQADEEQQASSGAPNQQQSTAPAPSQAATFGNPSPYVGQVTISNNDAAQSNPAYQYIEVQASAANTSPVTISGWSLQSEVSGSRAYIPEAASVFVTGTVNTVGPVYLKAGDSAIITTGTTPVGTSFRENICSGYLAQVQSFSPGLSTSCPDPSQALPETAQNLQTYGSSCFDYLSSLAQCDLPGSNLPSDLSPACQAFVANTFSYNGCVNTYENTPSFALPVWRLYLNMRAGLWDNTHDIIRLLDDQGRTVDVLTY